MSLFSKSPTKAELFFSTERGQWWATHGDFIGAGVWQCRHCFCLTGAFGAHLEASHDVRIPEWDS